MSSIVNDKFSTLSSINSQEISPPSPPYSTYLKFTKITLETPVQDYHYNMGVQLEINDDPDADGFKQILAETREVLWQLLFGVAELAEENSSKAAVLLGEYRHDACYYNPWDYNDWILKVKDELLRRKYLDFWEKLVKYQYGLITTRDSSYFDDFEDPRALEFYNEKAVLGSAANLQPSTSSNTVARREEVRPRLCGDARKRLRLSLDQGMSIEEARVLCLKPIKEVRNELRNLKIPRKRRRSDESDNANPPTRATGAATCTNSIANSLSVTESMNLSQNNQSSNGESAQIVRLGVIPPDFPATMWSDEKLRLVQTAVLDKIVELKKGSIKPQFSGCSFKPGWIIFNCKDNNSAQWVREHVPTIKPWSNAELKVISVEDAPRADVFIGYFREKPETPTSRILSLIEGQNDDLCVDYWKVLNRVSKGNITEITFAIDPKSALTLKNRVHRISYGYETVHIRPAGAKNDVSRRTKIDEKTGLSKSYKMYYKNYNSDEKPSCSKTSSCNPYSPMKVIFKSTFLATRDEVVAETPAVVMGKAAGVRKGATPSMKKPITEKRFTKHEWRTTNSSMPRKGCGGQESAPLGSDLGKNMAERFTRN